MSGVEQSTGNRVAVGVEMTELSVGDGSGGPGLVFTLHRRSAMPRLREQLPELGRAGWVRIRGAWLEWG